MPRNKLTLVSFTPSIRMPPGSVTVRPSGAATVGGDFTFIKGLCAGVLEADLNSLRFQKFVISQATALAKLSTAQLGSFPGSHQLRPILNCGIG